jgi:hypothetical protein
MTNNAFVLRKLWEAGSRILSVSDGNVGQPNGFHASFDVVSTNYVSALQCCRDFRAQRAEQPVGSFKATPISHQSVCDE